jgi:hypothetical protein
MKSKYRKYKKGGPVKPKKKREKVYTDRAAYEKALQAYQDSIALNNYYRLQQEIEPESPTKDKAAYDAMQELVMSGGRDTSRINELRALGNQITQDSDGRIQWAGNNGAGYSPDLQYYSVQDDPNKGTLSKMFDKLTTNTMSPLINKASKYWLGNAYNAVWDEPNVKPVFVDESDPYGDSRQTTTSVAPRKLYNDQQVDPIFEEDPEQRDMANTFARDMNPKVAALYNTPGALYKYQSRFMDNMLRRAVPMDTTYYDPELDATVSAGIYEPSKSNGAYSYFKISTDNPLNGVTATSKKPIMPKQAMVTLPPKLPFGNMDLTKPPALRRVLPEIYSRRLNQQTGEYIYDTSDGEIRKKVGDEDAAFYNMFRDQIEGMRSDREGNEPTRRAISKYQYNQLYDKYGRRKQR